MDGAVLSWDSACYEMDLLHLKGHYIILDFYGNL